MKNIDNNNAEATITIPLSEYNKLKSQEETLEKLIEQLISAKKKQFGSSSEKSDYLQLDIFNEAEVYFDSIEINDSDSNETDVKSSKKKKQSELPSTLPEGIPVEKIECGLSEDELDCPECGYLRHVIGRTLIRRELAIKPAEIKVKEIWQLSYGCRNCENTGIDVSIEKGDVPNAVIKGGFASPEAIAYIATQKFLMSLPLYRQEQDFKRKGIELSRQTMSNWLINASKTHLTPIYEKMKEDLITNSVLHADETNLQVLQEPEKRATSKSFMWLYRTGTASKYPIVIYDYQQDRKYSRPKDFLQGYEGYLQVDGYGAYKKLPEEIIVVGCFAHARRKFTEALEVLKNKPPDDKKRTIAGQGVLYCNQLFELEQQFKDLSYDERKKNRQELAKPILDEMFAWCSQVQVSGKTKTGEALTYLKNQWKYLVRYIDDGRLEISNNRAERSIKPFVIGRKNFLFANTPSGAKTTAILYSIIETAKENDLDPYRYLTYILEKSANMCNDTIDSLLPSSPEIQENCKSQ